MDLSNFEQDYKKITNVFCPYLNSNVMFTPSGFNHLIRKKGNVMRDEKEILGRMNFLRYLKNILEKSGTLQEYDEVSKKKYFAFIAIKDKMKFKVVIAKVKDGRYVFVSIIPKWVTGKRDKRLHNSELKNPSNDG